MSEAKLSFLKNAAIAHYIVAADTSTIHAEPKKKREYFAKPQGLTSAAQTAILNHFIHLDKCFRGVTKLNQIALLQ